MSKSYSSDGERVRVFEKSVDLSAGYEVVDKAVQETVAKMGPVYMLVNCAGTTDNYTETLC